MVDPLEEMLKSALDANGVWYRRNVTAPNGRVIDFYLYGKDVYVECKRMSTPRIGPQVEGLENVIVLQGKEATQFFCELLGGPSWP